jgi:hypothetical protein
MAQNLPDVAQARPGPQHLRRRRVAQPMRPDLGQPARWQARWTTLLSELG